MNWDLQPKKGISSPEYSILLGNDRTDVRKALKKWYSLEPNEDYPDEDDFLDESTFIRVRYDKKDKVQDIEFLGGNLSYSDIPIHAGTNFKEIETQFEKLGLAFRYTEWLGDGKDCVDIAVNIATHEDVGGDGDDIEWVILSKNFE